MRISSDSGTRLSVRSNYLNDQSYHFHIQLRALGIDNILSKKFFNSSYEGLVIVFLNRDSIHICTLY